MVTTQVQNQRVAALTEVTGETSVVIQAGPQVVYDYLVNFTRHPEWVANVSKVTQVSPGAIGVGTIFHTQESAPPVPFLRKLNMMRYFIAGLISGSKPFSEAEITALEPGKLIAWQAGLRKGNGWFNRAEWELSLQPQGQGTKLTQRFRYLPQTSTAARMIDAAGEGGITQACAVSLQRLKRVLEK
jgi:uncharacterized protein YndB with AHSA1/START domain